LDIIIIIIIIKLFTKSDNCLDIFGC